MHHKLDICNVRKPKNENIACNIFSISAFHQLIAIHIVENSGFSVIQILREINFGESSSSKIAILQF